MEEKTELNDIILNKGSESGGSKKILLAVATLAIILIIVVVIMNTIKSDGGQNLPQPVLPPEPTEQIASVQEDPLFEPVDVIEETPAEDDNLDKIAQKLKEETMLESVEPAPVVVEEVEKVEPNIVEPVPVKAPVKTAIKTVPVKPQPKPEPAKTVQKGSYYVQVGSFSKSAPNKAFLNKITGSGYRYTYHKVPRNGKTVTKVLIGPFESEKEARNALKTIRKKVEKGAFLTKV